MPELPEVETVRRIIEPQIKWQTIESVQIYHPQIIATDVDSFEDNVIDQTITRMTRKGKFLTFQFQSGDRLILHLRMTGQLLVTPEDYPLEKHTHLVMDLSGGNQIRYIDVRRFGRFWYLPDGTDDDITGISNLGIDPLYTEVTSDYLIAHAGKQKIPVKEMLMDQHIIAGIGNIYADEILYSCRIHPAQPCNTLTKKEWQCLAERIPLVLLWGIDSNDISPEDYLATQGKSYRNTPQLLAYGHEGDVCPRCATHMERIVLSGRSSCFCPKCQKLRPPKKNLKKASSKI